MKLLTSHFGTAGLQVSNDEVAPPRGFIANEIIEFIAQRYKFSVKPIIPPQVPPQAFQVLQFQNGEFVIGEEKALVIALALVANGDIVSAMTTEMADKILDDLISNLETHFGFRYSTAKQRRVYQSNLTVQFESGLEDKIAGIKKMESILNGEISRPELPFKIKRLAFGGGEIAPPQLQTQPSIEIIERGDFILERRTGAEYTENRYFSGAPLKTVEHIRILELLERELG